MWSGVFHVLASPLAVAAIIGVALAGAGVHDPWIPAAGGLAAGAAALASTMAAQAPLWLAPALVAVVGLAAVSGPHTKPLGVAVLSLAAGTAAGLAAELDQAGTASIVGVAAAVCIGLVLTLLWTEDLGKVVGMQPVLPIAKRIAGSWIAAIGILLLALALRASGH